MDRNGWSEYLKKQRLQDLKSLAKQLGIYIKSNTKKSDCIDIILNSSLDTLVSSFKLGCESHDAISNEQSKQTSLSSINAQINIKGELKTNEINEYSRIYPKNVKGVICSMCHQGLFNGSLNCDICLRNFHDRCVGFDVEKSEFNNNHMMIFLENISKRDNKSDVDINSIKFVCPFCRFFVIDPYNKIVKPLFFTTVYSYTAIHNIHPKYGNINFSNSIHLPQFTSKFSFSPSIILDSESFVNKEMICDNLMIYCLRLDRMDLNHEYPRLLSIKANNKVIQCIESPSYDHLRRDCPIDLMEYLIDNQLATKGSINISFNTLNALFGGSSNEQTLPIPTAPYIIGLFHTKPLSCDNIVNWLVSEKTLSIKMLKARFKDIMENKYQLSANNSRKNDELSDEIICLNNDQYLNTICPLTMDIMELPGRGVFCHHINCFDVKAFIQINSTIKAFNTRWKCPLCYHIIRPNLLLIDNFVKMIIDNPKIPRENNKIIINSKFLDSYEFNIQESINCLNNLQTKKSVILNKNPPFINDIPIHQERHLDLDLSSYDSIEKQNKDKVEVIDISDDEDGIVEVNFTINEEELDLLFECQSKTGTTIQENHLTEKSSESRQIYDLANINVSENKRKRSPESLLVEPKVRYSVSSNNDKTSLSLKI
ncbi:MIZ zinc finger domain-containing protein [Cryptosporidium felis]|nr:MIZ zinc finger domain-containing protein [Cryptosporidium felis]